MIAFLIGNRETRNMFRKWPVLLVQCPWKGGFCLHLQKSSHDQTFFYLKTHKLIFCVYWRQPKHAHMRTHSPIHPSQHLKPITCTIQSYFATGQKGGQHAQAHQHNRAHFVPPPLARFLPSSSWNLIIGREHHEVPVRVRVIKLKMAKRQAASFL